MTVVRFLRNAPPYMAGELAGFPDQQAEKLITDKTAEPYVSDELGSKKAETKPAKGK